MIRDGIMLLLALTRPNTLVDTADVSAVADLTDKMRPSIDADRALLCLDCSVIFEAVGVQSCPRCGSHTAWAMGQALNRQAVNVVVEQEDRRDEG